MTPAEIAHNKRIELYARKIRRLFTQAAGETGSLALLPGYDPNKPFSIENYPNAKTKMDKILREVANDTRAIITKGIDTEWYNANKKPGRPGIRPGKSQTHHTERMVTA